MSLKSYYLRCNLMILKCFIGFGVCFYSPLRGRRLGGSAFSNAMRCEKAVKLSGKRFIKWELK